MFTHTWQYFVSTTAKCINCESEFHTYCALRVAGFAAVRKNNVVTQIRKLLEQKTEILGGKETIILEPKAKEALVFEKSSQLFEKSLICLSEISKCRKHVKYTWQQCNLCITATQNT